MKDGRLAIHVALTAVMAWFCFILALPVDTFDSSQAFRIMAATSRNELAWSCAFGTVAAIGLFGLLARDPGARLWSVVVVTIAHAMLATTILASSQVSTGTGTYFIVAWLGLCPARQYVAELRR